MQKVVPTFRIKSFEASKPFYEQLGFEVDWTHQFDPDFPIFASLMLDGMQIFLTEHSGDCAFGGKVHFYIEDVDGYYHDLRKRKVSIHQPPQNSLGPDVRDMQVVDPDGNKLAFLTVANG